jgi:hypothetical protein
VFHELFADGEVFFTGSVCIVSGKFPKTTRTDIDTIDERMAWVATSEPTLLPAAIAGAAP